MSAESSDGIPRLGVVLGIVTFVTLLGATVVWMHQDVSASNPRIVSGQIDPNILAKGALAATDESPLAQPTNPSTPKIHSLAYGVEHGVAVVKIQVVPNGDMLIVDAATGKLLETRPTRPPGGQSRVPAAPM